MVQGLDSSNLESSTVPSLQVIDRQPPGCILMHARLHDSLQTFTANLILSPNIQTKFLILELTQMRVQTACPEAPNCAVLLGYTNVVRSATFCALRDRDEALTPM